MFPCIFCMSLLKLLFSLMVVCGAPGWTVNFLSGILKFTLALTHPAVLPHKGGMKMIWLFQKGKNTCFSTHFGNTLWNLLEASWTLDSTHKAMLPTCTACVSLLSQFIMKFEFSTKLSLQTISWILTLSAGSLFSPCSCFSSPSIIQQTGEWTACQPLEKGHRNDYQSPFAFQRALSSQITEPGPAICQDHLCYRAKCKMCSLTQQ